MARSDAMGFYGTDKVLCRDDGKAKYFMKASTSMVPKKLW